MDYDSIETSRFLAEFNPLIHKTLHRLQITKSHMDYEDYFQELQIHLLKIRKKYKKAEEITDKETERYKFLAYADKGLYLRGINLLKKNQKAVFHSVEDEDFDWLCFEQPASDLATKADVYVEDFFKQAKKILKAEEYLLLLYLSDEQYTTLDIAELMGISRVSVYNRKQKLQEKLEKIKDGLKL